MSALRIGRPGEPTRLIRDNEPILTKRQEEVLHWCRSFGGNRTRTARHLGISHSAVQNIIDAAAGRGAKVPPRVTRKGIRNNHSTKRGPRCGQPLRRGPCTLIKDHPHHCRVSR